MNFLSLSNHDIPDNKINTECIPKIDAFIQTLNTLKDAIVIPEQKQKHMFKFKRIIDIIELVNNPEYNELLDNLYRNIDRMQKIKQIRELRDSNLHRNNEERKMFSQESDNKTTTNDDDEPESDEEFKQDEVDAMLKQTYNDIKAKSTLQQKISLIRTYVYKIEQVAPMS